MRKLIAFLFVFLCMLGLVGCFGKRDYTIKIVVPAGTQGEFVYSDEEISPVKDQLIVKSIDIPEEAKFVLKLADDSEDNTFECTNFPMGVPMIIDVEKGKWVKIGISMQNPTDEDFVITINLEKAKIRIP